MRVWLVRVWVYVAIAGLAAIGAVGTLAIDPTVRHQRDLQTVRYGYPFDFVTSNADYLTIPRGRATRVAFNPRENPSHFEPARFVASTAVIAALPITVLLAFELRDRRINRPAQAT